MFFDPPGFLDTKGVEQEILNAYSNSKMFTVGRKAKIVIVLGYGSLIELRGQQLIEIARRLRDLLNQNFHVITNACLLIVPKTDDDETAENIEEMIKDVLR